MERCTLCCRTSMPNKKTAPCRRIQLGPLPVDERARFVESVCNTLDDSRNDRFWWNTIFLHAGRSGWITGHWTGEPINDAHTDIEFIHLDQRFHPPLLIDGDTRPRQHDHPPHQPYGDVTKISVDVAFPYSLTHPYVARGPTKSDITAMPSRTAATAPPRRQRTLPTVARLASRHTRGQE